MRRPTTEDTVPAKNQQFTGTCYEYTYDGMGVVQYGTFCVFVKDMMIGETGKIVVTALRSGYGYGRLLELDQASSQRVAPRCPLSRPCGGCQLQHMSPEAQNEFKRQRVVQALKRIARLETDVAPAMAMADPWGYRNKVIVPVGKDRQGRPVMGFYRNHSHDIVPLEYCALQSDHTNEILRFFREQLDAGKLTDSLRYLMVKDFAATGETMVVMVTDTEAAPGAAVAAEELMAKDPAVKSVWQNVHPQDSNVILSDHQKLLAGAEVVHERLNGLTFEVAVRSFNQVNSAQAARLYRTAVGMAELEPEDTVLDLYCGVGTIGLSAAGKVRQVIGVETVESAVADARRNAERNGIANASFLCADAGEAAARLAGQGVRPDVVFVDPPRKGCSPQTLEAIGAMGPRRLVYVSCDPSTLARDIRILAGMGYEVKRVQPVDMFPQTYHVETVCLLSRKK
jgi:23S rRNA (uracil1939-C5)-methyltransferase